MSIHAVQDERWAAPAVAAARRGRLTAVISSSVHGPRTWTIAGDVDLQVSRLLTLTGVDAQLPTIATLDAAVAAPASGPQPRPARRPAGPVSCRA